MKKGILGWIRSVDPILFAAMAVLSLLSILTIFGGMENFGRSKLIMQSAMTLAGGVVLFMIANMDYRFFVDRMWLFFLIASVLLLAITLVFGNSGVNMETANKSWLRIPGIGISIQPSEFVKITFLCTFSKHIDLVKDRINRPAVVLSLLAHAGLIVGLILLSGDLGVALVYVGIIGVMLFCSGLSVWYFLAVSVLLALVFPLLWDLLQPYQQERILYGFRPELDPKDVGLQPLLSRETIAGGGFFGIGLFGKGRYEELPASHTDFIFSTVCEKFGFLGGFLVVAALVVMAVRLLWLGFHCSDMVGRLICSGIAAVIIIQTAENLWMCLGLVPVVGITLPFMSAGGSSVLALYALMGLAHSVSAKERKKHFHSTGHRTI